jgi:hypothetical protein
MKTPVPIPKPIPRTPVPIPKPIQRTPVPTKDDTDEQEQAFDAMRERLAQPVKENA